MLVTVMPISKLTLDKTNPRKISKDQFEKLCNSLRQDPDFFTSRPCLVQQKNDGTLLVYAGNQRIRAAKKLGWKEVPCIIEDNISNEIVRARIVKDNVHHGEFDWDMLSSEYDPLELIDMGMTENMLQVDTATLIESEEEEKQTNKKEKLCPNCGHDLGK